MVYSESKQRKICALIVQIIFNSPWNNNLDFDIFVPQLKKHTNHVRF